MDLMLVSMKNYICPLIFTIILPNVLTLRYPMHIETLAVIYWNSRVALTCKNKTIDVSQLYKIMVVM